VTQYKKLAQLLRRQRGATAMEIVREVGTVCPHKRMSELKDRGWVIWRVEVQGKNYGRYFGKPPEKS
jgi:hypothetical protein